MPVLVTCKNDEDPFKKESTKVLKTFYSIVKIVSEYDQEIPQSQTAAARKSRSTITRHQEDKLSKAISSLFPIKMIAMLEWTQSNIQQNIEQPQTPTMGVTINKKSMEIFQIVSL